VFTSFIPFIDLILVEHFSKSHHKQIVILGLFAIKHDPHFLFIPLVVNR